MTKTLTRRLVVGITGASGSIYAERLISEALDHFDRIYLIATDSGRQVVEHELKVHDDGFSLIKALRAELNDKEKNIIRVLNNSDLFASIASGTSAPTDMVIVPCSMGTLARVSHGLSSNLLERVADVALKEKIPFSVVPRETPLSTLHLENLLKLSQYGVNIVAPMPGFYQNPKSLDDTINFVVGKILESLKVEHQLYKKWNARMI